MLAPAVVWSAGISLPDSTTDRTARSFRPEEYSTPANLSGNTSIDVQPSDKAVVPRRTAAFRIAAAASVARSLTGLGGHGGFGLLPVALIVVVLGAGAIALRRRFAS